MHRVLNVYNKSVNLNLTVNRPQILFDLQTAGPFVYLAATSGMDMGLGGANICYLTQISAQTERGGKWSRTGQQVLVFAVGLGEGSYKKDFWGNFSTLRHLREGNYSECKLFFKQEDKM